jgi:hypothetical protein
MLLANGLKVSRLSTCVEEWVELMQLVWPACNLGRVFALASVLPFRFPLLERLARMDMVRCQVVTLRQINHSLITAHVKGNMSR